MNNYFHKDKPIIGLDISQTSLKVMAVSTKKWTVLGYGSLEVDPTKLQQSIDTDGAYLSEQLAKLLDTKIVGHLPSNHVVISLPTSRTYSRSITLPGDIKGDLLEAVRLEAEQSIPVPVDQLYIDYMVTSRTKESIVAYTCAAPRHIVDTCISAVSRVGLQAIVVEPSMNAVARLLKESEQGELPTVIVDIGAATTDVAILDSTIKVTGGVAVGGNTFTVDISTALKVSLEQAHQLKVLNGFNTSQQQKKIVKAVSPSINKVLSEIKKIMRYYEERVPGAQKIEQVLIIGSGSNMPGIGDYFTENLMMASRIASPWQSLNFAKLPQPARQFKPRYISVAGLALVKPKDVWQ
ncbi:MAG: pilus assembly protein PilM [Candidatus Saccharimonadales bacterium]